MSTPHETARPTGQYLDLEMVRHPMMTDGRTACGIHPPVDPDIDYYAGPSAQCAPCLDALIRYHGTTLTPAMACQLLPGNKGRYIERVADGIVTTYFEVEAVELVGSMAHIVCRNVTLSYPGEDGEMQYGQWEWFNLALEATARVERN